MRVYYSDYFKIVRVIVRHVKIKRLAYNIVIAVYLFFVVTRIISTYVSDAFKIFIDISCNKYFVFARFRKSGGAEKLKAVFRNNALIYCGKSRKS